MFVRRIRICLLFAIGALPGLALSTNLPAGEGFGGFDTPINEGAAGNGTTDDTAFVQKCAATGACFLPNGYTFLVSSPIQVPAHGSFIGAGPGAALQGNNVSGGIVQVGYANSANVPNVIIGSFTIEGSGTDALRVQNNTGGSHFYDIIVLSGTFTNGFWFGFTFGAHLSNLSVWGTGISTAAFHFDGSFNANTVDNAYTTLSGTASTLYVFYMQNDVITGGSSGNTFNTLVAQGANTGIYVGGGFGGNTLNSPYTENVVFPLVFGNFANGKLSIANKVNAPVLLGPYTNATNYSSRVALIDFNYSDGNVVDAPILSGSFGVNALAPLTFTGGGCTTSPVGIARVSPSGALNSALLLDAGVGCTSNPSVSVGGGGGTVTASGFPSSPTLSASGGGGAATALMPIIYTSASRSVVNAPVFSFDNPVWPWVVRSSTAVSTAGVTITNDIGPAPYESGYLPTATLLVGSSYAYQHYLEYINNGGTAVTRIYIPPSYP